MVTEQMRTEDSHAHYVTCDEYATKVNWNSFNGSAHIEERPGGATLFRQGDPAREFFYIESGMVKLVHVGEGGRECIVDLRSPGRIIGLAPATLGEPYPVSAITLIRSMVRRINAAALLRVSASDPDLCLHLRKSQSHQIMDDYARFTQVACLSARVRFERLLARLIAELHPGKHHQPVRLKLPLRNWEIAQLLLVTPAYLSRLLKSMEQEGIIQRSRGWLTVLHPSVLAR
jgi:CRP-like cAMP-binding protein